MYKYLYYAKLAFQSNSTYRTAWGMSILFSFLNLIIRILVWQSLYRFEIVSTDAAFDLNEMMTYTIVSSFVGCVVSVQVAYRLEEKIQKGDIAVDFLRPVSTQLLLAMDWLGGMCFSLISNTLPSIALGILLVGGIAVPTSWAGAGIFVLSLILGMLINLMLELCFATFAFFLLDVTTLKWLMGFFSIALSGELIPLWMLPDWLIAVAKALPFQAAQYIPVQIWLGGLEMGEIGWLLLQQVFWIIVLGILQAVLWQVSKRKIVIQGG